MAKFRETWASQSDIGKKFGISAVAVGKILSENGLRELATKAPSEKAVSGEWCVSTPLRDGTSHFLWNIKKVEDLIKSNGKQKLDQPELIANDLIKQIKASNRLLDQGDDKLGYLSLEDAFNQVPQNAKKMVARLLVDKGYKEYLNWLN